jgi:hypothetical protein
MYHTFDFIDFVGKNYLDSNKIKTHTVTQPFYFAPGACSPEVKKELVKFYEDKMRSLNYESNRSLLNTLVEFVKYLKVTNEEDVQNHLMSNKQHMSISLEETLRRFDEINNTSYKDVCPWLEEIFK